MMCETIGVEIQRDRFGDGIGFGFSFGLMNEIDIIGSVLVTFVQIGRTNA